MLFENFRKFLFLTQKTLFFLILKWRLHFIAFTQTQFCDFHISSVPPSIVDKETSSDMVVREGSNVSMACKAEGYPEPYIMWRREDGDDINYNGNEGSFVFFNYLIWLIQLGILPRASSGFFIFIFSFLHYYSRIWKR